MLAARTLAGAHRDQGRIQGGEGGGAKGAVAPPSAQKYRLF